MFLSLSLSLSLSLLVRPTIWKMNLFISASVRRIFGSFSIRKHWLDRTRQKNHWKSQRLGLVGAVGGVFGIGRIVVLEGTSGTSQFGICRRLLCRVVRFCRRHHQCTTLGRHYFFFPIGVRVGILRLSHDLGGRSRRSIQDDPVGSLFNFSGNSCFIYCLFVVDESVRRLYWTIHYSIETNLGSLSGLVLLHFFGVVDLFILE